MSKEKETKTVKITEEELKKVNKIQVDARTLFIELGQLTIQRDLLLTDTNKRIDEFDEYEKKLMEQYQEIQKTENQFIGELREKYGDGELNPSNGEFIPVTE